MSKVSVSGHEKLAQRLCDILLRLNQGDTLDVDELAAEYKVHRRTILRDLNQRFVSLDLQKDGNRYSVEPARIGKFTLGGISHFAKVTGLNGLFPAREDQFFREIIERRDEESVSVHAPNYEDLAPRTDDFRRLQDAIKEHLRVRFGYSKDDGRKSVEVNPYRLINHSGVWYLAAVDGENPKSYAVSKIRFVELLDAKFEPDPAISQMLDDEDSIWLNTKKTEVILKVSEAAAEYFSRRKLIAQQVVEKQLEDGGLIISGRFAHPNQILPIVRYWLPNVRIVSPESWQEELEEGLKAYLQHG